MFNKRGGGADMGFDTRAFANGTLFDEHGLGLATNAAFVDSSEAGELDLAERFSGRRGEKVPFGFHVDRRASSPQRLHYVRPVGHRVNCTCAVCRYIPPATRAAYGPTASGMRPGSGPTVIRRRGATVTTVVASK